VSSFLFRTKAQEISKRLPAGRGVPAGSFFVKMVAQEGETGNGKAGEEKRKKYIDSGTGMKT